MAFFDFQSLAGLLLNLRLAGLLLNLSSLFFFSPVLEFVHNFILSEMMLAFFEKTFLLW
jgi:hypothetical protein